MYANLAETLNIDNSDDDDESDKGSYESIKRYLGSDSDGEDPAFYYNVPDLGRAEADDDNMYVYMKSGLTTKQKKAVRAKVKDRQRTTSEQQAAGSKKYVNYSREQQQARLEKSGKENGLKPEEGDPSEEDGPLYANCEGEEELYTELS